MGREQVVHDHKVNLAASRQLDSMQSVEPAEEGVWVLLDVRVVLFQDRQEELVFGMTDGFDDETVVAGKIEEGSRFSRGAKF